MISILISLIIFGFLLYLVGLIPMDPVVRRIFQAVAAFVLVLWILSVFGLLPHGPWVLR